jgi:TonB family protein
MRRSIFPLAGAFALTVAGASAAGAAPSAVVPVRVTDEPVWVYPPKAEQAGIRHGEARAVVSVSEEGELLDFIVIGCTHPAFAEEVAASLPKYRFAPAKIRGEPTTVRMPLSFFFQQQGTVVSVSPTEQWQSQFARIGREDDFQSWICLPRDLDRPLTVAKSVSPRYPNELRHRGEPASVTIDFFVDGEGRVRMPAADATASPGFAREAASALSAWQFEPPTSNGRPVIVQVTQTFRFAAPREASVTPIPPTGLALR